ncbi:STN domain-containing protein, partial [Parabacteroides distasonis]
VSADTYAQKAQVTVEVKNGTFYDVVSEIEKQTEFMFFYKSEDIDNSKQVDIQVKNRQVTDVLNELLKNTNLTYRISGKHITILKKDAVQQQKKKISGIVTDPDGIPVIGANVVIKGTTVGTVTDLDGKFSLDAANNDILSFSYIGYAEQEIEVGNRTLFNVKLAEDYKALEEVVVVGYGT